jgi:phenylacetate-coenzyme A ligase PaaK-like adenylate-forming protein
MATSGTTGRPLRRVFSARDWTAVLDRLQRNPSVGPGDIAITLGPIDGLMGPTASAESAARAGAMMVLAGLYSSAAKVRLIAELRPAVVAGAASYLLHLIEVAKREGIDLAGHPIDSSPAHRGVGRLRARRLRHDRAVSARRRLPPLERAAHRQRFRDH